MKKLTILFIFSFLVFNFSPTYAQKANNVPASKPGPDGYVRCATVEYVKWMELNDPSFKAKMAAAEKMADDWQNSLFIHGTARLEQTTYTIPVVVHVLWSNTAEQIPYFQVQSQIKVLNNDYNRLNKDTVNTPAPFKAVAGKMNVTFCLAQIDPNGNVTNGVVYKQVPVNTFYTDNDAMKYPSLGGDTAWDVHRYLNIWVCNMAGGILGYSVFPYLPLGANFGSVILYSAFGDTCPSSGTLLPKDNLGRTATHEIGHLLSLHHPWGDDGGLCPWNGGTDDSVADTPPEGNNQSDGFGDGGGPTFGCPSFPYTDNCSTSSPGIMYEDFMEYTDDACMNLFSHGQVIRALAALNGPLASLLTSDACGPLAVQKLNIAKEISIYPNPNSGTFTIQLADSRQPIANSQIEIWNVLGEDIYSKQLSIVNSPLSINLSNQPNGLYFVKISNSNSFTVKKVMINR